MSRARRPAPRRRGVTAAALAVLLVAIPLGAQPRPAAVACAPIPAAHGATFAFGHEAGNLRPRGTTIRADGRVARDSASVGRVAPDTVAALARLARTGGFWALHPAPITRPTRNPDAAREFIGVRLTCGRHRVVYPGGEAPPAFAALLARLQRAADAAR